MDTRHRISGPPDSMFYIPNFITEAEESKVLESIPLQKWISLTHRRLQALPARLTATNTLITSPSGQGSSLPSWLTNPVVQRIHDLGVFEASTHGGINHCLINEYLPGQGIMPHEDGGAYWPVVATVSLGGSVVLDVTAKTPASSGGDAEKEGKEDDSDTAGERVDTWRILQEPRSLLVTCGSAYTGTLHGIAEVEVDEGLGEGTVANWSLLGDKEKIVEAAGKNARSTRVSLTFRDVKKVSKLGSKVFGKART